MENNSSKLAEQAAAGEQGPKHPPSVLVILLLRGTEGDEGPRR